VCPFNSSEVQNFGCVTQVSPLLFGAGGDGFQCQLQIRIVGDDILSPWLYFSSLFI
jgi:hypothetical protein